MAITIARPESIQGDQTLAIWNPSKSKNRPSWQGIKSTGRPEWP